MVRPCFLVVDREHAGSISTRKLVIETAKLNVLTAYSAREALAMHERFPNLDGVILDARVADLPCADLIAELKSRDAMLPVVVIGSPGGPTCGGSDHYMEAFEPGKLLDLLKRLVPEARRVIEREKDQIATEEVSSRELGGIAR